MSAQLIKSYLYHEIDIEVNEKVVKNVRFKNIEINLSWLKNLVSYNEAKMCDVRDRCQFDGGQQKNFVIWGSKNQIWQQKFIKLCQIVETGLPM